MFAIFLQQSQMMCKQILLREHDVTDGSKPYKLPRHHWRHQPWGTWAHSADYAVARCLSVCSSVTRRYYV